MVADDPITYRMDLKNVDWQEMKDTLVADDFDNGRSPEQLKSSFENSHTAVVAYAGQRIIGTARALSDGVCNAYVVDVWTLTAYRHRGIASRMMSLLEAQISGQHVYLFTDDARDFYEQLGYRSRGLGLGKVVGEWLKTDKNQLES